MSNVTLILVGLFLAVLGGGASTFILALLKENEYLRAEVQFLGEEYNALADNRDRLVAQEKIQKDIQSL